MPSRHSDLISRWKTNTFDITEADRPQSMFSITKSYIWRYSRKDPTNDEVKTFVEAHADWKDEAFAICPPVDMGGLS